MTNSGDQDASAHEAESPEAQAETAPRGVVEVAPNSRARCRACGEALVKGQWRLGERTINPFGEGETTYWFDISCGASRRPEVLLAAFGEVSDAAAKAAIEPWREAAQFGARHPRAARLAAVGIAPSGRARCRHCRELIDKGELRMDLSMFNDGRFDPMGYLHIKCLTEYVGDDVPLERVRPMCDTLTDAQRADVERCCSQVR